MKTIKLSLLAMGLIAILSSCSKYKIKERDYYFLIENKSNKVMLYVYIKNGNDVHTYKTSALLPGESEYISKYQVIKENGYMERYNSYNYAASQKKKVLKKIKVVGKLEIGKY